MKKILLAVLLLLTLSAHADESKTFTWTPPTAYTNGLPLPNTSIASYAIYCDSGGTAGSVLLATIPNVNAIKTYTHMMPSGSYTCFITATTTVSAGNKTSVASVVTNFTSAVSVPNAPSAFSTQ